MKMPEPHKEHEWLHKLVGEWTYEFEAQEPDKSPEKLTGTETVRSMGGIWVLCEGQGEMPGGGIAVNLITLGYDTEKKHFVGTFIGSMMTSLWVYDGWLEAGEKVLTLEAHGPSFTGDGTISKYHDVIELQDSDHRTMTSSVLGEDGQWQQFMKMTFQRKK